MSEQNQINNPSIDEAYKFLKLVRNPDGSVTRLGRERTRPATPEFDPADPITKLALTKDVPLNPTTNTFIRLFRPRNLSPNTTTKLPLIIYFHGGSFILSSAASPLYHNHCSRIAAHIPAIVASVDYRLAPEHRLPAAYEDGVDAIMWSKAQAMVHQGSKYDDEWLKLEHADFSRVFLMGTSCGGNIVYNVGLRVLDLDLQPMKIAGLIMNQPPFGGLTWTQSELKNLNDPVCPQYVTDLIWLLALPNGADKGHEYCNPWGAATESHSKNIVGRLQACMVRGYGGDPLIDRHKEFAKMLKARGVRVVSRFIDGGYHSAELFEPKFVQSLFDDIKYFINFSVRVPNL